MGARAPIAIIGMACRLPGGVVDLDTYWRLLAEGRDAVGEIPAERIDLDRIYAPGGRTPGKTSSRHGGFLEGIEDFDAEFFGFTARAAARIDPQQRLLLEIAWEALEDAGLDILALKGSRTGVFVGQWSSEFEARFARRDDADLDSVLGGGRSASSGRLSNLFGFRGPSLTLDAACASSLAAVHLAARSLAAGDCDLALAGGVNIILEPDTHIAFSQAGMLASGGACRFGDATRDGYVRSEGAGLVVLKPLPAALADGDRVHAVLLGSALNHDGDSGGGLGRPGLAGQVELLEAALRDAGLPPEAVGYVEAQGAGTRAGDRVELQALQAVFGRRGRSAPLRVGSVKTNIGHAEAAAGVASLIKAALVVARGEIPASLHCQSPDPEVLAPDGGLRLVAQREAWPAEAAPRRAGVSAFGISGTNAHLLVEQAPAALAANEMAEPGRLLLPLSAHSEEALLAMADRYARWLEAGAPARRVCWSAATRRSALERRAVFSGNDARGLIEALRKFVANQAGSDDSMASAAAWLSGEAVDWRHVLPPAEVVDLPLYPWRRLRCWPDEAAGSASRPAGAVGPTVQAALAAVLQLDPDLIEQDQPLGAMGLTSLRAVELRDRLETAFDLRLPATLVYNHPTAGALAGYLQSLLAGRDQRATAPRAEGDFTTLNDAEVEALLLAELVALEAAP